MSSKVLDRVLTREEVDLLLEQIDMVVNSLYKKTKVRIKVDGDLPKDPKELETVKAALKKMKVLKLTVALEPTPQIRESIKEWVSRNLGGGIVIETEEDESILGGAKIYYKGRYGDFSLARKIPAD